MAESADATDLKSVVGNNVRVRPPLAPQITCVPCFHKLTQVLFFLIIQQCIHPYMTQVGGVKSIHNIAVMCQLFYYQTKR